MRNFTERVYRTMRFKFSLIIILATITFSNVDAQNLVSVTPDSAMQGNQVILTIVGTQTHFSAINNAFFISLRQGNNRISCDSFSIQNDSLLLAYFDLPYTLSGWCDVNVLNFTDGNMLLPNSFYITASPTAPNIISINPDSAYQGTSIVATILSVNTKYASGSITRIRLRIGGFNGTFNADSFIVNNDTNITAYFTFPFTAATGLYDLLIDHNLDGTISLNDNFEVIESPFKPKIISVNPDSSYQGTSLTLLVIAANTNFTQATFSAISLEMGWWDVIDADTFTVINDTALYADFTIPMDANVGLWDVVLNNSIDNEIVLDNSFEVVLSPFSPQIISINPDSAYQGEHIAITVVGKNTHFLSGTNNYYRIQRGNWNIINADSVNITNDTLLVAYFTISYQMAPNMYDFRIDNTMDGLLNLTAAFLIKESLTAPAIIAIYPSEGVQNEYVKVSVNGTNSHFLSGVTTQVLLRMGANNSIYADSFDIDNDSLLYAHFNIPLIAQTGIYDFRAVNNVDGTLQLGQSFTINATQIFPKILSVTPNELNQKESYALSINCQYTSLNTQTPPIIRLLFNATNIINTDSIQVVNDTFLYAYVTIPENAPIGFYDVEILPYAAQSITGQDMVEVLISQWSPQISLVDPAFAYQGDTLSVSIHGKNTLFTSGAMINVQLVQRFTVISPSGIKIVNDSLIVADFIIPANARLGLYDVEVNGTIHGDMILAEGFEILVSPNAPQIEYVSPAKAAWGEVLSVLVKGKNTSFVGSTNPRVRFQSNQGNFISDSVHILSDTIAIAYVTIPKTIALGFYDVRLWGFTENLTLSAGFEVISRPLVIKIKSITPDSAYQGDSIHMNIQCSGTEFTNAKLVQVFLSNPLEADLIGTSVEAINDSVLTVEFVFKKDAWIGLWDVSVVSDISGQTTELEFFSLLKSTGMQEANSLSAKIYPNPASDMLNIEFESDATTTIQLYDLNGNLLVEDKTHHVNLKQIDISHLASGSYIIQLISSEGLYRGMIIKK